MVVCAMNVLAFEHDKFRSMRRAPELAHTVNAVPERIFRPPIEMGV
jgi:hypothetical protein